MEAAADSDSPMDMISDGPPVEAPPVHSPHPRSSVPTVEDRDIVAFVSSLERPRSRRVLHSHESFVFSLEGSAVNPEASTDHGQPQAPAPARPSVVWFIPNEPRVPQEGSRRRECPWHDASGDSRDAALRVCRRHGHHNLGKHVHLHRSHHHRRCRSCPPDPRILGQGQGHGSGRPPHRPHRIWIPSGRLFRNNGMWLPGPRPFFGRHGLLPGRNDSQSAAASVADDPISAALEENARAMQSLRITSDVPEAQAPRPQEQQQGAAGGSS